ncbi:unnamed protein product [Tenebrio molitor]|nr:unnamed protein product [Tenebrio molitor]
MLFCHILALKLDKASVHSTIYNRPMPVQSDYTISDMGEVATHLFHGDVITYQFHILLHYFVGMVV